MLLQQQLFYDNSCLKWYLSMDFWCYSIVNVNMSQLYNPFEYRIFERAIQMNIILKKQLQWNKNID